MDVEDLDWGDVLVDTGDVIWCEARLDDDAVWVKRWRDGALDAELACRRALARAGVASLELVGWGPDWLVVEDMGETLWRPVAADELDHPAVARALGGWFARVHAVPLGPGADDLPPGPAALLDGDLLGVLASAATAGAAAALPDAVARWRATAGTSSPGLAIGTLSADSVAVIGQGLDAMVTDLSMAHAAPPADDVSMALRVLGPDAGEAFLAGYAAVPGARLPSVAALAAQRHLDLAVTVLVGLLGDRGPGAGDVARLEQAVLAS